jgi:hypothetical protein
MKKEKKPNQLLIICAAALFSFTLLSPVLLWAADPPTYGQTLFTDLSKWVVAICKVLGLIAVFIGLWSAVENAQQNWWELIKYFLLAFGLFAIGYVVGWIETMTF